MANNSTQRYLDIEKSNSFFSGLSGMLEEQKTPEVKPLTQKVEIDIDVDIEKQIAQLQEARLNGTLEKKEVLPVDPDKQLKEWQLEKEFSNFLDNVGKEKEKTERNIKEEEKKISALEDLLGDLTKLGKPKKKKKQLLVEPEKVAPVKEEVKKVLLRQPEKIDRTKDKEEVTQKYIKSLSKDVVVDENARKIVSDKYGDLSSKFDLSKQLIESDPDIISKVEAQIKEMRMNNELEKDKMNSLRSIDTLEKLTREFLNFKQITSMQMQTIGGGGGVQLLDMDDVNVSTKSDGFILKYNASTERMDFVTPDSGLITGLTADGSNNVTIAGNLTVQGTTTTVNQQTVEVTSSFIFEGDTDDANETTLGVIDPTADRSINLPNASGTIVLQDTTDTFTNKSIDSDNNTITNIVNADIKAAAAIAFSKMEDLTASRALVSDGSGDVSVSAVTATEIGYLDGVSSAIQTQLDAKQATISSSARLNANLIHDGTISNTEFGHLNGVSSNVQTQLDTKATNAFAIAQAVALG